MDKTRILVFTGTRAEYGILFWLIKDLQSHANVDLQLLVSGAHLCSQFGSTYTYIEDDGFEISHKVDMVLSGNTPTSIVKSVGIGLLGYAEALEKLKPDVVLLLGDRYEAFAMAQASFLMGIPIVHLHGGEVTQGANDDRMRHAITKLADLHFTSTESHRSRVIQMGEQPDNVINSGAPGLGHIERSKLPSLDKLSEVFDFDFSKPYVLIAFHPVTNSDDSGIQELQSLLNACLEFGTYNFVVSSPNADHGSSMVTSLINDFKDKLGSRVLVRKSYGHLNFLTIIKHAVIMLGNSSSGVIEAPSLFTPSIDVGIRQKGRERAHSVYSTEGDVDSIRNIMKNALNDELPVDEYKNPYFQSGSGDLIISRILHADFTLQKIFYDV